MRKILLTLILVLIISSVSYSVKIKSDGSRQFVGSDLTGKFELFVKQGSCPKTILHKEFAGVSKGAYQIPHNKIVQDDSSCTGDGSLAVLSKKAIDEAGPEASAILKQGSFKGIIDALEQQSTDFLVGYEFEKRSCGKTSISANSKFIFVEDSKQIKIPGLIELFPGAKYMIVYDKNSPTPCTYAAQSSGSVIGEPAPSPKPINAKPAPGGPIPSESSDTGESSAGSSPGSSSSTAARESNEATTVASSSSTGAEGSSGTTSADDSVSSTATSTDQSGSEVSEVGTGSSASGSDIPPSLVGGVEDSSTSSESGSTSSSEFTEGEELPESSAEPSGGSTCFSGDSLVKIQDGSLKRMSEIEIGDVVSIGSGKFSPVFMFTHKSPEVLSKFLRIATESNNVIEVTPGHYIYSNNELVDASTIKIGDKLSLEVGIQNAVTSITRIEKVGIFNPQTVQGDIAVNGIIASTFTSAVQPHAAQSMLAPLRAAFKAFGLTCDLFNDGVGKL